MRIITIMFISLCCILMVTNCSSDTNNHNRNSLSSEELDGNFPYYINLPKNGKDTLKASYFADTVEYVRFKMPEGVFVKSLVQHRVRVLDSIILINNRDALLMFSRNGDFIRQIGRHGRGPGEYIFILNFEVIGDSVYVSSTGLKYSLLYTLDGEFIEKTNIPTKTWFNSSPDGKLVCYDRNDYSLLFYNRSTLTVDTVKVEKEAPQKVRVHIDVNDPTMIHLQRGASNLFFTNYITDTVWTVACKEKHPAYIFNLGNKLLPEKWQVEYHKNNLNNWQEKVKSYIKVQVFPVGSKVFIYQNAWMSPIYSAIYIYDTKKDTISKFETYYFYDDITAMANAYPIMSSQSMILGVIDYNDVKTSIKNNNPSYEWLKQMKDIDENNHPILVIYKLKK